MGVIVAPALAAPTEDPEQQLEATQRELATAEDELAGVEQRLGVVEAEVARADARLAGVQGQLDVVENDLEAAQAALLQATDSVASARDELVDVDGQLEAAEQAWQDTRTALESRVAATWMHGSTGSTDVLLRGILAAEDLHDVAVVRRASSRLLDRDRELVDEAVATSVAATEARTLADEQRQEVEGRAADAYRARDRAERLVEEQADLVAEAEQARTARAAALRSIEEDAQARAALVAKLDARVEDLEQAILDQWEQEVADVPFDGPAPPWAGRLPAAGRPVAPAIAAAAARAGIDGRLLAALVWTESGFNRNAVSPAGAVGLAQLMPATAAGLGVDPGAPLQNLTGGARYLRTQLDRFGRVDHALAAYNAGPASVAGAGNRVPDIVETQLYVLRVLERWESLT